MMQDPNQHIKDTPAFTRGSLQPFIFLARVAFFIGILVAIHLLVNWGKNVSKKLDRIEKMQIEILKKN